MVPQLDGRRRHTTSVPEVPACPAAVSTPLGPQWATHTCSERLMELSGKTSLRFWETVQGSGIIKISTPIHQKRKVFLVPVSE